MATKIVYIGIGFLWGFLASYIRYLWKYGKPVVKVADPSSKIKSNMDEIRKHQEEIDKLLADIDELRRSTTETLLRGIKEDKNNVAQDR